MWKPYIVLPWLGTYYDRVYLTGEISSSKNYLCLSRYLVLSPVHCQLDLRIFNFKLFCPRHRSCI